MIIIVNPGIKSMGRSLVKSHPKKIQFGNFGLDFDLFQKPERTFNSIKRNDKVRVKFFKRYFLLGFTVYKFYYLIRVAYFFPF